MKKIILLSLIFAINLLQAQVPQSERDALIALYNATDGQNWTYQDNWNTSNPVSSWYGLTVENINGQDHVTKIELQYNNLTGNIPADIVNLSQLIVLNVRNNNLSGNIPVEIGNLSNLMELNLGNNQLTGTIPTEIGNMTNLTFLRLSFNDLSGSIPSEIGNLTNLNYLSLAFNNLTGSIPANFSSFTSAIYLFFSNNHLSGVIPDFSSIPDIQYLYIYNNDFHFADLEPHFNAIKTHLEANNGYFIYSPMNKLETELSIDMVTGNNYTFTMPTINGTGVTYQWYHNDTAIPGANGQTYSITNAQDNDLGDYTCKAGSPVIPDLTIDRNTVHLYGPVLQSDKDALLSLYNATDGDNWTHNDNWNTNANVRDWYGVTVRGNRVFEIDLSNNQLNGYIPGEIGNLSDLKSLWIDYNNISGNIPPEIGNLSNLTTLNLRANQLTGNIPVEIGNLSDLKYLNVWNNQLTGNIPSQLGNLSNLEYLAMDYNHLTGNIPANLSNLNNLVFFYIENNQLTGDIPAGLFDNMSNLYKINLSDNNLTGNLYFSNNHNLYGVWCYNMQISSIDIRNGNNSAISYFDASINPNLSCIFVDDKNASYLSNWYIDSNTHFVETQTECNAIMYQTTYVPDDNFENYLETHDANGNTVPLGDASSMGNGIANDDLVLTSRISNVISLNVRNKNISDLTGIEDFTDLQLLNASRNNLNTINLSQNNYLLNLNLSHNQFNSIDVSSYPQLTNLDLCFNQLTNIDVSQNTNLTLLSLCVNQLNNVDLSNNINLEYLDLGENNISNVDLSHNTHLKWLYLYTLNLSNISLNQLSELKLLHIAENHLNNLDLSQNPNIETLFLYNNELTDLDVSQNQNVSLLWVYDNNLSQLNVQNGHNSLLTGTSYGQERFRATGNPNLTCIFVDDENYCANNWTQIDSNSHFVETQAECDALGIDETFNENINVYPNPFNDLLNIELTGNVNIKTISVQNMQGQTVYKSDYFPQINVSKLSSGLYLLHIEYNQGNTAVFKLVKN